MAVELLRWFIAGRGVLSTSTAHFCGFFKSDPSSPWANLQLAMRPFSSFWVDGLPKIHDFPALTMSAIQTQPYSRGNVRIMSNDPTQRPRVDTNYLADERDVKALIGGMRQIRKIAAQRSLQGIIDHEEQPGVDYDSDEELTQYLREEAAKVAHPTSTIRMGSDERAPLTPRLRVRGIEELRVADASVMPQITSGNTNAPSIMIGERAAAIILEDQAEGGD
jgi:choline dehydrogenase